MSGTRVNFAIPTGVGQVCDREYDTYSMGGRRMYWVSVKSHPRGGFDVPSLEEVRSGEENEYEEEEERNATPATK